MNNITSFTSNTLLAAVLAASLILGAAPAHAQTPAPPPRFIIGPPNGNDHAICFRELFEHPDDWKQTRDVTGALLYADWPFKQFADADLTKWFAQMRAWNLPLELEVGAVKQWGKTGAIAFKHDKPGWDRIIRLGGNISGIAMDEPRLCATRMLHKSESYAAAETAAFIALVRQNYPQMRVGDIETYPSLAPELHKQWIADLQQRLADLHVRGLDFYRIDVNWPAYNAQHGSYQGLKQIEDDCREIHLPFSVIYWAADLPGLRQKNMATDATWTDGIMTEGKGYDDVGGKPDQYVVESWVAAPSHSVPETSPDTFTGSCLDFYHRFVQPNGTMAP